MICKSCNQEKDKSEFHFRNDSKTHRPTCKPCWNKKTSDYYKSNKSKVRKKQSEYYSKYYGSDEVLAMKRINRINRRARILKATPAWFDKDEVNYIYNLAAERGLEVDHIVPLQSDKVCGLHVQDNMRCITGEMNNIKGNRRWPDMWKHA